MYYKDSLLREDFLGYLYRGNYILYKDIREKKDGTNYNYEDLYLKIEEEYVPGAYGKAGEESSIEDGLDYGFSKVGYNAIKQAENNAVIITAINTPIFLLFFNFISNTPHHL